MVCSSSAPWASTAPFCSAAGSLSLLVGTGPVSMLEVEEGVRIQQGPECGVAWTGTPTCREHPYIALMFCDIGPTLRHPSSLSLAAADFL